MARAPTVCRFRVSRGKRGERPRAARTSELYTNCVDRSFNSIFRSRIFARRACCGGFICPFLWSVGDDLFCDGNGVTDEGDLLRVHAVQGGSFALCDEHTSASERESQLSI